MRMRTMWLVVFVVLTATARAHRSQSDVSLDPVGDATAAFDHLIRDYGPGMDTAELNELTWQISKSAWGLAINGNYRVVGPFTKWLGDTAQLPDEARQYMLSTLGVLGDTAAADVVMRHAADTTMNPPVRYDAAVALCLLGKVEAGTRMLEGMALKGTIPLDGLPTAQFWNTDWTPIKLKSTADERAMTLYFRWLAERATGRTLIAAVCYLLQRDAETRAFTFRIAERALQAPEVYLPGVYPPAGNGNSDKRDLLGKLAWFGGKRGKALAAKCE